MTPLRAAAEAQGRGDFTPLWAGQSSDDIAGGSASDITRSFIAAWNH
jgi:nitronate monooxygenase